MNPVTRHSRLNRALPRTFILWFIITRNNAARIVTDGSRVVCSATEVSGGDIDGNLTGEKPMDRIFCRGSGIGLVALGLVVSFISLGVLNNQANADCEQLCFGACADTVEPNGGVVCPAGSCTGWFCAGTCTCIPDRSDTRCKCD